MVKYTGGCTLGPVAVGPGCAFDDRLLGDRLCRGYGKGVLASGGWVYEARYSRSIVKHYVSIFLGFVVLFSSDVLPRTLDILYDLTIAGRGRGRHCCYRRLRKQKGGRCNLRDSSG
jgi:hypothetical protein